MIMCRGTKRGERSVASGKGKTALSVNVAKNRPRPSRSRVLFSMK